MPDSGFSKSNQVSTIKLSIVADIFSSSVDFSHVMGHVAVNCKKIVSHISDQTLIQVFGFLVGIKTDACKIDEVTTCCLEAVVKPVVLPY